MAINLSGSWVAMPIPFDKKGAIDYDGFKTVSPGFPVNEEVAQAVSNTDAATEWKTVSYTPSDDSQSGKNTNYTVSAKDNEIKIVIKSDYINGDKLTIVGDYDGTIKVGQDGSVTYQGWDEKCCPVQDIDFNDTEWDSEQGYGFLIHQGKNRIVVRGSCCEMGCIYVNVDSITM